MRQKLVSTFLGFCLPLFLSAQLNNQILDPDICSVQLTLAGSPLSMPIVNINTGNNTLVLQFDHLGDALKDYKYTLIHCDSDWQRSDLSDNEYIDGFTDDRITNVSTSFNTLAQYTHYVLGLPKPEHALDTLRELHTPGI